MPECGAVESALGVAIAKMQLAQRDALEVFEGMWPHMIRDEERSEWLQKLVGAHLALEIADYQLTEAGAMLHPDGARYPRSLALAASVDLLRALESVEAGLYAEWLRADGSGKHLTPLIETCWEAIIKAGGDSVWSRRRHPDA